MGRVEGGGLLWMSRKMSTSPVFEPPPVQLVTSRYAVSSFTADDCMDTRGLFRGQNGRETTDLNLGSEMDYSYSEFLWLIFNTF